MRMRKTMIKYLAFCMVFFLAVCGCSAEASKGAAKEARDSTGAGHKVMIPKEIEKIPERYFAGADRQGALADLYYQTYESFSYAGKTKPLRKHAIVYFPYGYDKDRRYDVFYLMHGGWGDETTTLGTPKSPSAFKNVLDHAIAAGEMRPMIIVCPTYNNTNENGRDSDNFSLAMRLTENFHHELINDLIPAVEGSYKTFAASSRKDDLIASRDHRGFGGFSMGSVTTWRTFQYGLDYFKYFLPMSCGTSLKDEEIFAAANDRDTGDYFVFVMTGTNDFAFAYDEARTKLMRVSKYFSDVDAKGTGNFAYRVKTGYSHDGTAAMEYTYNGMKAFWGGNNVAADNGAAIKPEQAAFTVNTKVQEVISDSAFKEYGRLLFPANTGYYSGDTLGNLSLTWYGNVNPNRTVEIANFLKKHAAAGDAVFYDIYSDKEKARDPDKKDTGLFFFRGDKGAKTAVVNAGGGFVYVGAMQDSFPHALALSKKGYNAFALIYRPGAGTACEDLARAIAFLHKNAARLEIDMKDYSLWGGSAGARMAAWLGSHGTENYGEAAYPRPAAVVMEYTGLSEVTGKEPPTYACVGTNDGIASYRTMQDRIDRIKANGTAAEIEIFQGLPHGFGLGEGTVAEGWLDRAVAFWEKAMKDFIGKEGR